jgi:hypothetical protein
MSVEGELRQRAIAQQAAMAGLPEWQQEMVSVVPDRLVRDIVSDNQRPATPNRNLAPPAVKATGWVTPQPIGPRPATELEMIDRLAEKFCGPVNGPIK